MDQCKHCQLRGDMVKCYQEDCAIHESWYAKELFEHIKELQNTSSNSEYMAAVNEILHNRLDYLEGVENTNNIVQWIIEDIQCLNQRS